MITINCDVFKLIDPPLKSALTENKEKTEEITEEKTTKKK